MCSLVMLYTTIIIIYSCLQLPLVILRGNVYAYMTIMALPPVC